MVTLACVAKDVTRGLGQVTTKKMENKKKTGITIPRPDGGVKRLVNLLLFKVKNQYNQLW